MTSEDVLLQVPQVRYKKGDGTLYLMDQRIAWMLENRDNFSISHLYADIKGKLIYVLIHLLTYKRLQLRKYRRKANQKYNFKLFCTVECRLRFIL